MTRINIRTVGVKELRRNLRKAPSVTKKQLTKAVSEGLAVLAENTHTGTVPHDTTNLIQSFGARQRGLSGSWAPDRETPANYAEAVLFGTRPHVIRPRKKEALFWKGADHPVKKVNHPGTNPNDYLQRIANDSEGKINRVFRRRADIIANKIAKR